MAFGDTGKWRVWSEGVPFLVDAASQEAAADLVRQKLESGEVTHEARTSRMGLSTRDVDVLRARRERAGQQRAAGTGIDPDAAVRGKTNVADALGGVGFDPASLVPGGRVVEGLTGVSPRIPLPDSVARLLTGAGRYATKQVRGVEQILGGRATEEDLAAKAKAEEDLYNQFGTGVGLEDVGEALIPALAFYATGGLTGSSALGAFGTGAVLGATEEQTDPSAMGRLESAAVSGAEAAIFQRVGNAIFGNKATPVTPQRSLLKRLGSVFRGNSIGAGGPRWYFQPMNFFRNPATHDVGVVMTQGVSADAAEAAARAAQGAFRSEQAQQYARLSNEVLGKLEEGIRALPSTERAGAIGATQDGLFQGILRSSIEEAKGGGASVVNPTKWRQGMAEVNGRLPSLLKYPEHRQLVQEMNSVMRAMESLRAKGTTFTAENVDDVLRAIKSVSSVRGRPTLPSAPNMGEVRAALGSVKPGPSESDAVEAALAALRQAEPGSEAQQSMIQVIIDKGRSLFGAAGERTGEETRDYGSEVLDTFVERLAP